ncbi:hypothetical protein [Methylobacterium gnaphalii]|uniref:Uncharacterized protein n=1 Tax=Methylobacterium gnaphalii TaxID=1010610 RepID=A0A512JJQ9_9HYPH|nr:hypothetical protein [Methylobacterium gnaphalii]GEP10198.1 hypothetical protein MGN01_20430 [Methylobacterium gnaphalii]GLS48715.1 hypothetical protein GCM10007885_15590 [Methylobacterium gnaphalii]
MVVEIAREPAPLVLSRAVQPVQHLVAFLFGCLARRRILFQAAEQASPLLQEGLHLPRATPALLHDAAGVVKLGGQDFETPVERRLVEVEENRHTFAEFPEPCARTEAGVALRDSVLAL